MNAALQLLINLEVQPASALWLAGESGGYRVRRSSCLVEITHISSPWVQRFQSPRIPEPSFFLSSLSPGFLAKVPTHSCKFRATSELDNWATGSPSWIVFTTWG